MLNILYMTALYNELSRIYYTLLRSLYRTNRNVSWWCFLFDQFFTSYPNCVIYKLTQRKKQINWNSSLYQLMYQIKETKCEKMDIKTFNKSHSLRVTLPNTSGLLRFRLPYATSAGHQDACVCMLVGGSELKTTECLDSPFSNSRNSEFFRHGQFQIWRKSW